MNAIDPAQLATRFPIGDTWIEKCWYVTFVKRKIWSCCKECRCLNLPCCLFTICELEKKFTLFGTTCQTRQSFFVIVSRLHELFRSLLRKYRVCLRVRVCPKVSTRFGRIDRQWLKSSLTQTRKSYNTNESNRSASQNVYGNTTRKTRTNVWQPERDNTKNTTYKIQCTYTFNAYKVATMYILP